MGLITASGYQAGVANRSRVNGGQFAINKGFITYKALLQLVTRSIRTQQNIDTMYYQMRMGHMDEGHETQDLERENIDDFPLEKFG